MWRGDEQKPEADPRFVLFDSALGLDFAGRLFDFASERRDDFTPAGVYHRQRGNEIDPRTRDCVRLKNIGPLRPAFEEALAPLASKAVARLKVDAPVVPTEFEICAYRDGGAFSQHRDMVAAPDGVRALTCVYYFSPMPRAFAGGELRIHAWPPPMPGCDLPAVDITPDLDRAIFLPSIVQHEVLPVKSDASDWSACRFSLTCWFWRTTE